MWASPFLLLNSMEKEDAQLLGQVMSTPALKGAPVQNIVNAFCRAWRLERKSNFVFKAESVQEFPFKDFC